MLITPLVGSTLMVCRTGYLMVITSSGGFYLLVLPYEQTRRVLSVQALSGVYNVHTGPLAGFVFGLSFTEC